MKQFRIALLASAMAFPLAAHAELPVVDFAQLGEWAQQLQDEAQVLAHWEQQFQQMESQLQEQVQTVRSLTNVPSNLIHQAVGLLSTGIQNPLGDIQGNLHTLMFGGGTGRCAGASEILASSQYPI